MSTLHRVNELILNHAIGQNDAVSAVRLSKLLNVRNRWQKETEQMEHVAAYCQSSKYIQNSDLERDLQSLSTQSTETTAIARATQVFHETQLSRLAQQSPSDMVWFLAQLSDETKQTLEPFAEQLLTSLVLNPKSDSKSELNSNSNSKLEIENKMYTELAEVWGTKSDDLEILLSFLDSNSY